MFRRARQLLLIVISVFTVSCATARQAPQWSDTYQSRLELLALIQTFNADVLASTSATAILERWCGDHNMASPPTITVQRVERADKPPSAEQLQRLRVADAASVKYRRVQLQCGSHVLSEADNWYVPARLTERMNELLETTDIPFGKVVRELTPYRRTIDAKVLWSPLEAGWELRVHDDRRHGRRLTIPEDVLRHTAILYTSDHQPFSVVIETYQSDLFAFRTPRPAR